LPAGPLPFVACDESSSRWIVPTFDKSKLTLLETVYPIISNQGALWLKDDPKVEKVLRRSDFYMIGARPEAKFLDLRHNEASQELSFTYAIGDSFRDSVTLRLRELPGVAAHKGDGYLLQAGEKIVRLWDGSPEGENSKVLEWFTTEKLIWDRSRKRAGVTGLNAYRDAAVYELLYVGIAKVGDSFDRLFSSGHKTRMEILANEPQRLSGARGTDETYLFLFAAKPMTVASYDFDHEFTDAEFASSFEQKRIVADAEKAFVSLLKPGYNVVRFTNYPKGADGLHGSEYARYGYVINEDTTFSTPHGRFRGGRMFDSSDALNEADCIHIEGDTAKLFISGVDFPSDYAPLRDGLDGRDLSPPKSNITELR